ncbi:hypothetical protein T265_15584, partial [Opisthorchis viverrini]
ASSLTLWGRDRLSGCSVSLLARGSVVRTRHLSFNFPCLGLGSLAVSQPSCFIRVAWQLGTERVLRLNDNFSVKTPNEHGVIEVAESPVNKFQILINVTSEVSYTEQVRYAVRHTEDSLYVELIHDQAHPPGKPSVPGAAEETELIELLPNYMDVDAKPHNGEQPTAQFYITSTSAYATISMASSPDTLLRGATGVCPTSYPIPRYVVAGGDASAVGGADTSVTYGQSNPNDLAATILGTPIILSANAAGFLAEGASSPPVAYVQLANVAGPISEMDSSTSTVAPIRVGSQQTVHSSLRLRTLPGKRHVAKEFLDESVVATMTKTRSKQRTILPTPLIAANEPTELNSSSGTVSSTPVTAAPVLPLVYIRTGGNMDPNPVGAGSLSPASIPNDTPVCAGSETTANLVELIARASTDAASSSFSITNAPTPQHLLARQHPQPQGSDETSGILSDSDGSVAAMVGNTLLPNALLFSSSICPQSPPAAHSTTPEVATLVAVPAPHSQSSIGPLLAAGVPFSPPNSSMLPLSTLFTGLANSSGANPFNVSSALIAEMASCPQHSYLFCHQQNADEHAPMSDTIASVPTATETMSTTSGEPQPGGSTLGQGLPSAHQKRRVSPANVALALEVGSYKSIPSTTATTKTTTSDDYSIGSGSGIPDVPALFTTTTSTDTCQFSTITADNVTTLGRNRFGPNPPKRGVSLMPRQNVTGTNGICADSQPRTTEQSLDLLTVPSTESQVPLSVDYKSASLGRPPKNGPSSVEGGTQSSQLAPGSSATLPSGGTNPRSALKSADRSGPKVSKHLRFTTLTMLTFLWLLVVVALGSPELGDQIVGHDRPIRWNIIKPFSPTGADILSSTSKSNISPTVRVTIWLPRDMIPKMDGNRPRQFSSDKQEIKKGTRRSPDSIQLWLNASSGTEVWLSPRVERGVVHIYDATNAHQILGTRICRQRYACEHSCDPGARHDCICQRGYRPAGPKDRDRLLLHGNRLGNIDLENAKGRICLDVDECASAQLRSSCTRLGGVCTNRPGDYTCLCPSGYPCLDCDTTCPKGFWAHGDCGRNQSIECKRCSGPCPTGMYEARPCGPRSDRVCQACRPLCISEEFEFTPCKGSSNRICKRKSIIPELIVPYKKNVWFENLQHVRDTSLTLTPDDISRLPLNKSIVLDRASGYQVRLDFDSLNLLPVLGPVDHSSGNDNSLFLASARVLDHSSTETDSYRWSSATGQYHPMQAYTLKANNTLSKLCPFPVPPLYRLGIRAHRNVTTSTVPDASLPGHRPVLSGCRTYRRHGYFPPVEVSPFHAAESAQSFGGPGNPTKSGDLSAATIPVVACLEPSRLPAIFGSHWNTELATPRSIYFEEKQLCGQLKADCQQCLAACAEELKSNSLTCKPTSNPADNGRSPRLEICFDCCARDNCSDVCDKYSAHRCHMQLCSYGLRLDFPLTPEWPKQGEFLCHVQPASSRPIYRLYWSLLYQGRPLTPDRFSAALVLPTSTKGDHLEDTDVSRRPVQQGSESWIFGHGGQISQTYRGLLNVQYASGLEHLPDMIGGTDTMQSAYFWSRQTIPLVSGSATNAAFDPISASASAATTGAMYANAVQSGSPTELASIQVWPSRPLLVSTAAWERLSGAPCAAADPLLEQLNVYTPALPPYIAMGEAKVEYVGNYLYTVSHTKAKPKLMIGIPKTASLLGAVFSPASVERGQYLRASLALAWFGPTDTNGDAVVIPPDSSKRPSDDVFSSSATDTRRRYWVIDLTGQVDQFPGLFRLRVYTDHSEDKDVGTNGNALSKAPSRRPHTVMTADATVETEDGDPYPTDLDNVVTSDEPSEEPLLDYDIGVFEERKFQLRILIPGPEHEPDYEKSFRLTVTDAKNRLDIRVKRTVQLPHEMALRRSYERLPDDDVRPVLADLLPSLAARQQTFWQQASAEPQLGTKGPKNSPIQPEQQTTTESELRPFGPPPSVFFAVICCLLLLLLCLFIGIITQPDPTLAWIKFPSEAKTKRMPTDDGEQIAMVRHPARYNSIVSRWCRVLLLIGYLCLKSAYTFGVTLTALVIVIRYVTRDPANQLTNLPEWTMGVQPNDLMDTSLTRQKLLQEAMDVHLRAELVRQQTLAKEMREACDRGLEVMFDQMEERLSAASKLAATRRSRVLLSQGVAELARVTAVASTLQLAEGLMAFNQSVEWAFHRLKSDLQETERALGNSDWLTGARIIYAEVVQLRGLHPDPNDPTRSFLQWAKLLGPGGSGSLVDLLSPGQSPQLQHPPPILPLIQPDQFQIPTPSPRSSGLTQGGDEPEYGPSYTPFILHPIEAEANEAYWSSLNTEADPSGLDTGDFLDSLDTEHQDATDGTEIPVEPSSQSSSNYSKWLDLKLGWVHVLGAALLLDALWLIHRVLHTVDTAERLLYGDTVFIDLTVEGLRRRLLQKSRLRIGCKRAFEAAMQPGTVRKLCGSVLALLAVSQGAAHLDRLLSQETLDYIGYYDNLILPVHLHARLVNVHITRSAQRLNQYEVAGIESEMSRRLREAQFLLHQWTAWLSEIEQEQCRVLLAYKAAAQQVRNRMATKLNRNPALNKLQLPVHMIHSGPSQAHAQPSDWSNLRANDGGTAIHQSKGTADAFVPKHCRMTQSEREIELAETRRLDCPKCPLNAIVPHLFKDYNASQYFDEVVKQSEAWLSAARDYLSRIFYCLFVYISALILWNMAGSLVWFYLNRLNILPKKVLFESDISSWYAAHSPSEANAGGIASNN